MPTQQELRKQLTDQILSALDEGVVPWQKPWSLDPNVARGFGGGRFRGLREPVGRGFDRGLKRAERSGVPMLA